MSRQPWNLKHNIEQGLKLNCPVVVSCSEKCDSTDIDHLPIKIVKSADYFDQKLRNLKNQIITTLRGLEEARTEFSLKIRSDEYFHNIEPFIKAGLDNPDRYTTCNIFFLPSKYGPLHTSDHLIFGKTEKLKNGFKYALENLSKFNCSIEAFLFSSFLYANGLPVFWDESGSTKCLKNYSFCVDIDLLMPYAYYCGGTGYTDSNYLYDNGYNVSIKHIDELEIL